MKKGNILVIDDERNILKMIEMCLSSENFNVEGFLNPLDGIKRAQEVYFDIAFVDLKMQPIDGLKVLAELKNKSPETTLVLITAHGSIETAVEAIKLGAYDYILKPFTNKEFLHITQRVLEFHLLKRKVNGLELQLEEATETGEIVTNNAEMQKIIKTASEVANSNIPVLIEGESGTGKEILSRYIHKLSSRKDNPFIPINCAAIPENLFESELFGHVKGSFTNAIKDRIGRLELANFGTVFLDEVSEIPKQMQVKLLRFLQNNEFERIGESLTRKIDVRIISATNRNIDEVLKSGDLRDDFYYRISTVRLKLPALRDRKEDIPLLTDFFIRKNAGAIKYEITKETSNLLENYDWPGNIRELENVVKRLMVFAKDGIIKPEYLPIEIVTFKPKQSISNIPRIDELEKQHIQEVLAIAKNLKEASRILGISETTLWRKKKQFGI